MLLFSCVVSMLCLVAMPPAHAADSYAPVFVETGQLSLTSATDESGTLALFVVSYGDKLLIDDVVLISASGKKASFAVADHLATLTAHTAPKGGVFFGTSGIAAVA